MVDYCLVRKWHYHRNGTAISIPVTVCINITRNIMLKKPQAGNDCFCPEWTQSSPHCCIWLSPKKHAHIRNGHKCVRNTFLDGGLRIGRAAKLKAMTITITIIIKITTKIKTITMPIQTRPVFIAKRRVMLRKTVSSSKRSWRRKVQIALLSKQKWCW